MLDRISTETIVLNLVCSYLMMLAFLIDQIQQRCCRLFLAAQAKGGRPRYFWGQLPALFLQWFLRTATRYTGRSPSGTGSKSRPPGHRLNARRGRVCEKRFLRDAKTAKDTSGAQPERTASPTHRLNPPPRDRIDAVGGQNPLCQHR